MSETAIATTAQPEAAATAFDLVPRTLDEAKELAHLIASSDLVPKDYKGKPANVMIAVQYGRELGLKPLQAVQGIAIINGRPSVWGDHLLALIKAHPLCAGVDEHAPSDDNAMTATCVVRRRGAEDCVRTFSQADAQQAGLWGKQGPWTQYPARMLMMRARSFALRDQFADVLVGLSVAEEVRDTITVEAVDAPKPSKLPAPESRTAGVAAKLSAQRAQTIEADGVTVDAETGEVLGGDQGSLLPPPTTAEVKADVERILKGLDDAADEDRLAELRDQANDNRQHMTEAQKKKIGAHVAATAKRLGVDL